MQCFKQITIYIYIYIYIYIDVDIDMIYCGEPNYIVEKCGKFDKSNTENRFQDAIFRVFISSRTFLFISMFLICIKTRKTQKTVSFWKNSQWNKRMKYRASKSVLIVGYIQISTYFYHTYIYIYIYIEINEFWKGSQYGQCLRLNVH